MEEQQLLPKRGGKVFANIVFIPQRRTLRPFPDFDMRAAGPQRSRDTIGLGRSPLFHLRAVPFSEVHRTISHFYSADALRLFAPDSRETPWARSFLKNEIMSARIWAHEFYREGFKDGWPRNWGARISYRIPHLASPLSVESARL